MADKPEVFISYSRTAPGDRPDAAADAEARRRWLARTMSWELVAALERALGESHHVWRDDLRLRGGDELGVRLDAALLSCAGVVVLLDPDAIERSDWVRWEVGIVTWRRRLGGTVRVVPVLIGTTIEDLRAHGFEPTRVDDLLAQTVDVDPVDGAIGVDAVAARIVDALGSLDAEPSGPIAVWIANIASCLPSSDAWLDRMVAALGDKGTRLLLTLRPDRALSRELVARPTDEIEELLGEFGDIALPHAATLKKNLKPAWVPPDAATAVAAVVRAPPGVRVVAVNAMETRTGADVVRRAMPGMNDRQLGQWTVGAVTVDSARTEVLAAIDAKWPPGRNSPAEVVERHHSCFFVLSCPGVGIDEQLAIVRAVLDAHPALTVVMMTGTAPCESVTTLEPLLPPDADGIAVDFDYALGELLQLTG